MSARNPMLCLACLSQMERKREWMAYSWSIMTWWTCIVAKKQILRAWKNSSSSDNLKDSKGSISWGLHFLSGHKPGVWAQGKIWCGACPLCTLTLLHSGVQERFWLLSFLPCSVTNHCPPWQDMLLLPMQKHHGHSLPCLRVEQGLHHQLLGTEGAVMQELSPAHPSGFHTAALPLETLDCVVWRGWSPK